MSTYSKNLIHPKHNIIDPTSTFSNQDDFDDLKATYEKIVKKHTPPDLITTSIYDPNKWQWAPVEQTTTAPLIGDEINRNGRIYRSFEETSEMRLMARLSALEAQVTDMHKRLRNSESELSRKNLFIEKLAESMALILQDPEKLAKIGQMKDLYDQYIMLGKMLYGPEFDKLLKGLR